MKTARIMAVAGLAMGSALALTQRSRRRRKRRESPAPISSNTISASPDARPSRCSSLLRRGGGPAAQSSGRRDRL